MGIFEDLKAKADANGDGKLSIEDVKAAFPDAGEDFLNTLKEKADQNDDGKLNLEDLKSIDFKAIGDQIGDTVSDLKNKLFGKK